jgi:hypothetical protein
MMPSAQPTCAGEGGEPPIREGDLTRVDAQFPGEAEHNRVIEVSLQD